MPWAQIDSDSAPSALTLDVITKMGTDPQLTDGTLVLRLKMTNAAIGDIFLVRAHEKLTATGDTQIAKIIGEIVGDQGGSGGDNEWWFSVPVLNIFGGAFSIEQTDGTGRIIPFSICAIT